ncbi:MAG TPA: RNA polymerase sigma factor [Ktedonosporobacter sp.]|nr:RNA polymerase sigma factor [Ktedonosporobacter sp.]
MTQDHVRGVNEHDLIQQAARGDHEAFSHIVAIYEQALLRYLTAFLGSRENALDIAQETFLAAFYALPHWTSPSRKQGEGDEPQQAVFEHPLTPWLYRIATNQALNFLNKQAVHIPISSQRRTRRFWDRQEDPNEITHEMSLEDRYALRELLREALSQLSEEDATCLVLRFVANERYKEIAARLGLTEEAVRKRISRGLTALRAAYQTLDTEVPL